jgi:hypothetical protein
MHNYRVWRLLWVLVVPALLSPQAERPQSPQAERPHLKRLMGLASEYGVVALDGNTVSAFSTENIRMQDASLQWRLADKKEDSVTIRVEAKGSNVLETPLHISAAHSFALCDRLNQIDERSSDHSLSLALPKGTKVKSLVRIGDELSLVVYSVSDNTVRYDIRVGLVRRESSGAYSLVDGDLATDSGNFCGVQQGDGDLVFVFADEPSGSSDFSAVYAYSVNGASRGQ